MALSLGRWIASAAVAGAVTAAASSAHAAAIGFCNFSNGGQLQGVQLEGTAVTNSGVVGLTTESTNQAGSAWLKTPISLTAGTTLKTHFRFRMYFNATDQTGGDGITFSIQNKGATANSGGSLAVSGLTPSVSVEFDTNKDNNDDPNANHVGVIVDGKTNQHLATATPGFNMKNGQVTDVWVEWAPATKKLSVYMTQGQPKPATPLLTTTVDIYSQTNAFGNGNTAYVGFTGSTSSVVNHQDITYWVLTNDGTEPVDCIPCLNDTNCAVVPTTPACNVNTGFCAQCSDTNKSQCTGSTPVCDSAAGVCVECNTSTDCSGNTPVCDNHVCRACSGDYNGTAPPPDTCQNATRPACQTTGGLTGACTQCSGTNGTQCNTQSRPVCLTATGTCGCSLDSDCGSSTSGLICSGNVCIAGCRPNGAGGNGCDTGSGFSCVVPDGGTEGRCTKGCTTDGDCGGATLRCDLNTNKCVQCLGNADCANGQICDLNKNVCGECTLGNTTNCDPNGSGGACLSNNSCGCKSDTDCGGLTSGRICDPTSHVCTTGCRGAGGNGCQPEDVCTSTGPDAGTCITNDGGLDAGNTDAGSDASVADAGKDSGSGYGGDGGIPDSGTVTPPGVDSGVPDVGAVEGGGCDCSVLGVGGGPAGAGALAAFGIALAALARRRSRR